MAGAENGYIEHVRALSMATLRASMACLPELTITGVEGVQSLTNQIMASSTKDTKVVQMSKSRSRRRVSNSFIFVLFF